MGKLIVLVGMPGSGKSHYIKSLQPPLSGICLHDYMSNSHGDSKHFTDSRYYADLIRNLLEGKECLIAEIEYCDTWRRIEVEEVIKRDAPDAQIEWRYFENDPEK